MLALVLALPALLVNDAQRTSTPAAALRLRGGITLDTKTLNTINGNCSTLLRARIAPVQSNTHDLPGSHSVRLTSHGL